MATWFFLMRRIAALRPSGDTLPEAILHENREILGILGERHAERRDLKWAGIRGIEPSNEPFKGQPPPVALAKVVGDLFFNGHRMLRRVRLTLGKTIRASEGFRRR